MATTQITVRPFPVGSVVARFQMTQTNQNGFGSPGASALYVPIDSVFTLQNDPDTGETIGKYGLQFYLDPDPGGWPGTKEQPGGNKQAGDLNE